MFFDIAVEMIDSSILLLEADFPLPSFPRKRESRFLCLCLSAATLDARVRGHDGYFLCLTAGDVNQPPNETSSQKHPPYNGGHGFVSSQG